jgi:NitT/TauT family transport system substrate-binding protein
MKKVLIIIMILALSTCLFVSCTSKVDVEGEITIAVPDGAPALAMAKLMKDFTYEGNTVNFEIVSGSTAIAAEISQGTADIAILPTNLACKLYNSGVDLNLIGTNIYGIMYLVGTEDITSLDQLKGQDIYCIGQGSTPEYILEYVLESNNISLDEVNIIFESSGSDIIPLLKTGVAKYACLGEPAATMSTTVSDATILFNLQTEWEALTGYEGYPQTCTVATASTIANHEGFLEAFSAAMEENVDWIGENVTEVNEILAANGSTVTFADSTVIANCNVNYIKASDSITNIDNYLNIMQSYNSTFVDTIPDADFYKDVA